MMKFKYTLPARVKFLAFGTATNLTDNYLVVVSIAEHQMLNLDLPRKLLGDAQLRKVQGKTSEQVPHFLH
jgi:hypothetical protein